MPLSKRHSHYELLIQSKSVWTMTQLFFFTNPVLSGLLQECMCAYVWVLAYVLMRWTQETLGDFKSSPDKMCSQVGNRVTRDLLFLSIKAPVGSHDNRNKLKTWEQFAAGWVECESRYRPTGANCSQDFTLCRLSGNMSDLDLEFDINITNQF